MTEREWDGLAGRIDALWPKMTGAARGAYFDVLRDLDGQLVRQAVTELARSSRERRPPAGLIYETALSLAPKPSNEDTAAPDHDPLPAGQVGGVMAQIRRSQSPEHARRAAAVKATGKRFPLAQLHMLVEERACSPEEFDRRLAEWAPAAPVTSQPEPAAAGRQRHLLDPDDPW